jgi:uncharacterized membrane protein YkvA (DUF1232 family)
MAATPLFSHMLDPETDRTFARLCVDVEHALLPGLVNDVEQHVAQAREALAVNEFLDVAMADKVASLLVGLINKIGKYPQEKQKLIVGAARYFIRNHDAQDDMRSLLGFDDDVAVLNYVLTELGHADMRIQL